MAKKHIRLTFFYTDEKVWNYIKSSKTRERLVKWANAFYDRYDFKIYDQPILYNEKLYKKKFVFTRTNGVKVDYGYRLQIMSDISANATKRGALYDELIDVIKSNIPDDEKNLKEQEIRKNIDKINTLNADLIDSINASNSFELELRKLISSTNKDLKIKDNRLPVVFAEFKNNINVANGTITNGENLRLKLQGGFVSWALLYFEYGDVFTAPFIVINFQAILTKRLEYTLAHEIVHAAGNTTLDNQGTAKNIMIYADAEDKSPTDVNLEASDKTKLEVAYFVK